MSIIEITLLSAVAFFSMAFVSGGTIPLFFYQEVVRKKRRGILRVPHHSASSVDKI